MLACPLPFAALIAAISAGTVAAVNDWARTRPAGASGSAAIRSSMTTHPRVVCAHRQRRTGDMDVRSFFHEATRTIDCNTTDSCERQYRSNLRPKSQSRITGDASKTRSGGKGSGETIIPLVIEGWHPPGNHLVRACPPPAHPPPSFQPPLTIRSTPFSNGRLRSSPPPLDGQDIRIRSRNSPEGGESRQGTTLDTVSASVPHAQRFTVVAVVQAFHPYAPGFAPPCPASPPACLLSLRRANASD